jgi:hypothetical protein
MAIAAPEVVEIDYNAFEQMVVDIICDLLAEEDEDFLVDLLDDSRLLEAYVKKAVISFWNDLLVDYDVDMAYLGFGRRDKIRVSKGSGIWIILQHKSRDVILIGKVRKCVKKELGRR